MAAAAPEEPDHAHRLPDEVRVDSATAALQAAIAALEAGQRRFDLSACERFDSSLLAVLLELARRAAALGGSTAFVAPTHNLRKLAALYGVDEMLFGAR